jgi:hypothetical protein
MPSPTPSSICLSELDLDAAAQPIAADRRDAFLQQVFRALMGCAELGPGHVHRAIVEAQRVHFDPPDLSRTNGVTKYR